MLLLALFVGPTVVSCDEEETAGSPPDCNSECRSVVEQALHPNYVQPATSTYRLIGTPSLHLQEKSCGPDAEFVVGGFGEENVVSGENWQFAVVGVLVRGDSRDEVEGVWEYELTSELQAEMTTAAKRQDQPLPGPIPPPGAVLALTERCALR